MLICNLPICPKCGDTKNVIVPPVIKLEVYYVQHACTKCKIAWRASPDGNTYRLENYPYWEYKNARIK